MPPNNAHLRRNFAALVSDYGLFSLGLTFASVSTILPAFAERLGASNTAIGAIPSIMTLGYSLPPLFAAHLTERLSRKLRFVLIWTIWERVPMLLLAAASFFLAERWPGLAILCMFLSLGLISGVGGVLMPAWTDLIATIIPAKLRGKLFGLGSTIGTGFGVAGAALSGYYLAAFPFPLNYSLCFATGFGFLMLSFVCLALVVEPEATGSQPTVSLGSYVRRLPETLTRDRSFAWYLASRGVGMFGAMSNGFVTVFALRNLGAQELDVAKFTFVMLAGQTVANLLFGYLGDRVGHKPVLAAGALAALIGNGVALMATQVDLIYLVFVCVSASIASGTVSGLTIVMEFAPDPERPTYMGLANTIVAPVAFFSPILGGLLADQAGYPMVFAVAAVASALSALVLMLRVSDPRAARG